MKFGSIAAASAYMAAQFVIKEADKRILLEEIGKRVEAKAKALIGQEDVQGINGFAAWAPLADSTVYDKQTHGYGGQVSPTDPLLRDGELRESITHIVLPEHDSVVIGSDSEVAKYQELGTSKIPPRSFLGIAAEQTRDEVKDLAKISAVTMFKR